MNQILNGTKELLGIPLEVTDFDNQLVNHINHSLRTLKQLGVDVNQITLLEGDFDDIMCGEDDLHATLQIYVSMKVRLLFDPPTSSFVLASLEAQIKELEWRLTDYESEE